MEDQKECTVCEHPDNLEECDICGELACDLCRKPYNGSYICDDCYENEYFTCQQCDTILHIDALEITPDTEESWCERCYDEQYTWCDICETSINRNDSYNANSTIFCEHCRFEHFFSCEQCGELTRNDCAQYDEDSEHDYCEECYEDIEDTSLVHNYNYKPDPIFYSKNCKSYHNCDDLLFLGIELEIEYKNANSEEINEELTNASNDKYYLKHDGSLDHGCEIVTHPMTLNIHHANKWESILNNLKQRGCRSHNTPTCGLHIHVNKSHFNSNEMINIGVFVHTQQKRLEKLAHRKQSNWSKFKKIGLCTDKEITQNRDRYEAVNFLNRNTIEFRLYKGTLNYKTFISRVELTHAVCKFCKSVKAHRIARTANKAWKMFVEFIADKDEYANLRAYIAERGVI